MTIVALTLFRAIGAFGGSWAAAILGGLLATAALSLLLSG